MDNRPIVENMCFSVEMEKDLIKLSRLFKAEVEHEAFFVAAKMVKQWPQLFFQESTPSSRLFPNGIAPIIVKVGSKRIIRPMRYRVRPEFSKEEVPSQYNLFNARRDSLFNRQSWNRLILKQHGLFVFSHFYEWVEKDSKKRLVRFFPEGRELMWAPVLYSQFRSKNNLNFDSFALITDDPPPEVLEVGHDRCPLFLKEEQIERWLSREGLNSHNLQSLLDEKEAIHYGHEFMPEVAKAGPIQLNLFDFEEK
ncbi:MAG: hypothetical protein COW00_13385 [Bdellovibrio sp. CG12_big_fil_rev_8_21_14_0_65_39_13]|nr:MAG: hypothetical protein COW78_11435 [Bdellovibrio sp. CG22_combo_CG10-13_8_21_14_all_39_27]PIQ58923.1 MAG: hypothetical protein COW00_13385 [Bdellovibrio sp. CG12_big_fil_rev_8_21_14_0_65_39_13]PIR36012.1 MAG: hypothetical protein COV37_05755 [Bdellovibrio sp. CG11_big_fil_rev_8_21_14_0_20_39_38]PJB54694.1 MAG: hypothetical protein CO099_00130 [Bdellovibrio sp. CG_4_9_14_3_um_filter_39_7]